MNAIFQCRHCERQIEWDPLNERWGDDTKVNMYYCPSARDLIHVPKEDPETVGFRSTLPRDARGCMCPDLCCVIHNTHSTPHKGCILR